MTENELNILKSERVMQIQIALSQRARIARAVVEKFGKAGYKTIRKEVKRDIAQWVQSVAREHDKNGIKRDIDGLHSFLWEQNKNENIEFSYEENDGARNYIVMKCPIAEFALKNGIAEWGDFFFCKNYKLIAETYNPKMRFKFSKKMMNGDQCCAFSYHLPKED